MPIEEAVETIATTCSCTACKTKSEPPSDLPEPVQRFMRQAAAFVRNPDAASAAGNVQLIARPGQQLTAVPEPGDILIRIVEGGSGHAAIVASTGLWHGHELRGNGLHPDTDSAEGYVHVTEHAPMRREASEGYARGVTDRGGRLLDDLILLRLMDPPPVVVNPSPTIINAPRMMEAPAALAAPVALTTFDTDLPQANDPPADQPQEDVVACNHIDANRLTWDGGTTVQLAFKQEVYLRQVRAACQIRHFTADVAAAELGPVEGSVRACTLAASACQELLKAGRAAKASDAAAAHVSHLGVVSGYRSSSQQFTAWNSNFPKYYGRTSEDRAAAPGGEHSDAAAAILTRFISRRLAAPGFSLHNTGHAIDFQTVESGHTMGADTLPANVTAWRGSWFFSWLSANANGFGFFQNMSIDEPWHWEYRGIPGTPDTHTHGPEQYDESDPDSPRPRPDTPPLNSSFAEDYASESLVPAGRLALKNTALLARHRGTQPDLILRWNDMTDATAVDIVIHLHGYSEDQSRMTLTNKEYYSGLDFTEPGVGTIGRTVPTLGIIPRGSYTGDTPTPPGAKKTNPQQYTFPALFGSSSINELIDYSLAQFHAATGGPAISTGRLILTAHSGGGAALMSILRNVNANEVEVFDALYNDPTPLISWLKARIASEIATWTTGKTHADSGLTVFTLTTRPQSKKVHEAIQLALKAAPADALPVLNAAYRVLVTAVAHGDIPRHFGWKLLADAATTSVVSQAHSDQASETVDESNDPSEKTPKAIPLPKGAACAYFFKADQYLRYNIATDATDFGPELTSRFWTGLGDFAQSLDASVNWGTGHVYFFKDSRYLRYNIALDRVDVGPVPIAANWPKLPADFQKNLGAAVNWGNGYAYFFKGARYLRYNIAADTVDVGPVDIATNWTALPADFQRDLDAVVNWGNGNAYFFKGAKYLRYVIATDVVDVGPSDISGNWPNLPAAFQTGLKAAVNWTTPVDLAELMRAAGLTVVEEGNWKTHVSARTFTPIGVVIHHTAGVNSLDTVINGDAAIPGPRCNLLIDKTGTVHTISSGHSNNAGKGSRLVVEETAAGIAPTGTAAHRKLKEDFHGNAFFYGIENENWGDNKDPWPEVQMDAIARASAALCHLHGWNSDASHIIGHKEFRVHKKDPTFDMDEFRARVKRAM